MDERAGPDEPDRIKLPADADAFISRKQAGHGTNSFHERVRMNER